jgi:hypothetical protein
VGKRQEDYFLPGILPMRTTIAIALFLNLLVAGPAMAKEMNSTVPPVATISALEKKFFSHSYGSNLAERVSRLERFVFGEERSNLPLTQRIARLTQTAGVPAAQAAGTPNKSISKTADTRGGTTSGQVPAPGQRPSVQSTYPRITSLERKLLGSTFEQQPLLDRLSRLECKVFGQTSSVRDFASRVDSVEEVAFSPKFGRTSLSPIAMDQASESERRSKDFAQALQFVPGNACHPMEIFFQCFDTLF